MYKVGEKVVIEGKICTIESIDNTYRTCTLSYEDVTFERVPFKLIHLRRLPALHALGMLGEIVTTSAFGQGVLECPIVGYRNDYDFDIEDERTGYIWQGLSKKRASDTLFHALTYDVKSEGNNADLESDIYKPRTLANHCRLDNNMDLSYFYENEHLMGTFKQKYFPKRVVLSEITTKQMRYDINEISYFYKGEVYGDFTVVETSNKVTTVKDKDGNIFTLDTLALMYGDTDNYIDADLYDGREHYINCKVSLRGGDTGFIQYMYRDGSACIRISDEEVLERTKNYDLCVNEYNKGDVIYSRGGTRLTFVESLDGKATIIAEDGSEYEDIEISDLNLNKLGRQSYDYTGSVIKNMIGQDCIIDKYESNASVDVRFNSGKVERKKSLGTVLSGRLYEGNFEYNKALGVFTCGNLKNPKVVDYDKTIDNYIVTAEGRYGTPDFLATLESTQDFVKTDLTVNIGTEVMQKCMLPVNVVDGWDDNNLMVRFPNGKMCFNISKADLYSGDLHPGEETMMLEKLHEQKDGSYIQLVAIYNDYCTALRYTAYTTDLLKNVSLDDVLNGDVTSKLELRKVYKNKYGMTFTVNSIADDKVLVLFEDYSKALVAIDANPLKVVPQYIQNDCIGKVELTGKVSEENILDGYCVEYTFTGTCVDCKKEVSGTYLELMKHSCK